MSKYTKDQWMKTLRVRIERADDRGCSRPELIDAKRTSPSRKLQEEALRALEKDGRVFAIGPKTRRTYIGRPLVERLYGRPRGPGARMPGAELTEQQLRKFYELDRHRRDGLASLPILWAWRRYVDHCSRAGGAASIDHFHETLGQLAKAGRIDLIAHDDPTRLGEEERALLRPRKDGSLPYYWVPRGT